MKILDNENTSQKEFEAVFKQYAKSLCLYAFSFLFSEAEAEDAVQEVFINFWKEKAYRIASEKAVKTYLFRSVKNNCLDRLDKKDVLRGRMDILYHDIAEAELMTLNDRLIREITSEIEQMPPQTREIIKAVFFEELKYQEVADRLGISVNTVKTLLKKGMHHLRTRYASRSDLFLLLILRTVQRRNKRPIF